MHYNEGADLLTYLVDPTVFTVKNGYVEALQGTPLRPTSSSSMILMTTPGPGLGIEINEALVREAASKHIEEKAWRNAVWKGEDGGLREW